jgi:hypothetical protein
MDADMGEKFRELDTKPQWVLVDGVPHEVSDYAHLPNAQRPDAHCPVCQELVTLKLGKVRIHHYAHRTEVVCPANIPETALHLNIKLHIADQLRRRLSLIIAQPCDGAYRCKNTNRVPWLSGWDEVEVEYRFDNYRPDIALLKDGNVLGAIEVLVSHAMSEEKERYFAKHQVSWVEVTGKECLYVGNTKWMAEMPLPSSRLHPESTKWVCEECEKRRTEEEIWHKEMERRRRYHELNHTDIHATKMVDVYFPSGKKFREVFYIKIEVVDGVRRKAWLEKEGFKQLGLPVEANPLTKSDILKLNTIVAAYLAEKIERAGAQVDRVAGWQRWVKGQRPHPRDTARYPFKFEWDSASKEWREPSAIVPHLPGWDSHSDQSHRQRMAMKRAAPKAVCARFEGSPAREHKWGAGIPWGDGTLRSFCHLCGRDKIIDSQGNIVKQPSQSCPGKRF